MPDLIEGKRLLEKATSECTNAKDLADKLGNYAAAKKRAQDTSALLGKLPADQKALIEKDLETINSQIELATAKAETEHKPADAVAILDKAQKALDQAKSKTDMHANLFSSAPNPDFVKLLVNEPGGTKVLDDLVSKMNDKTNRQVLGIALEARFNLTLEQYLAQDGIEVGTPPKSVHGAADNSAPDKSLKRMYEMLQKVPDSHSKNNPFGRKIERYTEDTGSAAYYDLGAKRGTIEINLGRAGATTDTNIGAQLTSPEYFPEGVDENCRPRDDAKDKDLRFFDWATLHEIGHAVDDNNQFMAKNMGGAAFGRWEAHGKDITKVADAAQKEFKYDLQYIKDRLTWGTPAPAAKPAGVSDAEWTKAKNDFDAWCNTIMNLNVWNSGEATKRIAIGNRVYQLAYGNSNSGYVDYVSYDLAARKQGILGYQFRSYAEWFAELYAAYYMDVLKPNHPAVKDWLPGKLK